MTEIKKSDLNKVVRGPKRATYNKEEIYQIVDNHVIAHLAYVHEGVAITIPTGYGRLNDTIYIHGSIKNRMVLSLLECEKVSATITHLDGLVLARSVFHHSVNYRSAVIFGTPRLVEEQEEKMKALELITENFIEGRWNEARQPNEKEFNGTLVVALDITEASAKIRAEGVNDEKADLALDIWAGVVPIKTSYDKPLPESDLKPGTEIPKSVNSLFL